MDIGKRLRELRDACGLAQIDIERRSGLAGSYISRVENGYTIPSLETLERLAAALGVHLYELFLDGAEPALLSLKLADDHSFGTSRRVARMLVRLRRLVPHLDDRDRRLLLYLALKMSVR